MHITHLKWHYYQRPANPKSDAEKHIIDAHAYRLIASWSYRPRSGSMRAHSNEKRNAVHPNFLASSRSSRNLCASM